MKYRIDSIAGLAVAAAMTACQLIPARVSSTEMVYGLSDRELDYIAHKIGFTVEPRGMSIYMFHSDEMTFGISAHNDISAPGGPHADAPVELCSARLKGGQVIVKRISLQRGMPMADVEQEFVNFVNRVRKETKGR
jgi:hypothetical protein